MRFVITSAVAATLLAAAPAAAQPTTSGFKVYLACGGEARGAKFEDTDITLTDRYDRTQGVDGSLSTIREKRYDGRVRVRIDGDRGTINVPREMMPPVRGKMDENGGFKLSNIVVTERTISGQFSFNFMNKPKFTIDRTTGQMEMAGFQNGFSGVCEPISDEPSARKF